MPKNNLKEYLKKLAQDTNLREQHIKDPVGTMTNAGIEKSHQDMIMNGQLDEIKKELGPKETCLILTIGCYRK